MPARDSRAVGAGHSYHFCHGRGSRFFRTTVVTAVEYNVAFRCLRVRVHLLGAGLRRLGVHITYPFLVRTESPPPPPP